MESQENFHAAGSRKLSNLSELLQHLESATPEQITAHFSEGKNDYATWVTHSLGDTELGMQLSLSKTREEMVKFIKERLEEIPDHIWVKTAIPGFDELITGGIPKGSSVLLSGGPGTGKTTFSLQLLANAARRGEKVVYLTFEEEPIDLKRHMKSYGWDAGTLERNGQMIIKRMQPFELSRSVEALLAKATGELTIELDEIEGIFPKGFKPDLVVLDSLSAVAAGFSGKDEGYRVYIEQLFSFFKKMGTTSFLISEVEQDTSRYSRSGVEEFLADGVVVFYNLRVKNIRSNALEILKLRGTQHQKKVVPFRIHTGKGIVVYPLEEAFA